MPRNTIIGVFEDERIAHEVADDLKREGFSDSDIHISGPDGEQEHHGGLMEWLENLFGGSQEETDPRLHRAIQAGRSAVAVDTDESHLDEAAQVMQRHGAMEVNDSSDSSNMNRTGMQSSSDMASGTTSGSGGEQRAIPIIKQDVNVGKKTVVKGGVRVYSRVREEPVHEQVRLRDENVRVERRPVDRPVSPGDEAALRDQVIEVVETREEPVVNKTSRVVEEVVVTKDATERTQNIDENVRRTDVQVEQLHGDQIRASGERTTQPGTGSSSVSGAMSGGMSGAMSGESSISDESTQDFRRHFQSQYATSGGRYEDYESAYKYGYNNAGMHRGQNFEDVEDTLRTDYLRNNPTSSWDRMRGAVRYGWERMTGKR